MSHANPLHADPVAFAATRHRIVINLSGGKDELVAGLIAMDAARQAGVTDRVWTATRVWDRWSGPQSPRTEFAGRVPANLLRSTARLSACHPSGILRFGAP